MTGTQKFKLFVNATTEISPEVDDLFYVYFRSDGKINIYSKSGLVNTYAAQGPIGPQGVQGPKGDQGETGPQGPQGETGPQGDKGNTGERGPQGDKGMRGETGLQGETGSQGLRGETGATGAEGAKGEIGPRGFKGDRGMQGNSGVWIPDWDATEIINNTTGTYTKGDPENPMSPGDEGYDEEYIQTQTVLSGWQGKEIQDQIDEIESGIEESKLYLTQDQYDTIESGGSIVIEGKTYTYNANTEYNVYEDDEE